MFPISRTPKWSSVPIMLNLSQISKNDAVQQTEAEIRLAVGLNREFSMLLKRHDYRGYNKTTDQGFHNFPRDIGLDEGWLHLCPLWPPTQNQSHTSDEKSRFLLACSFVQGQKVYLGLSGVVFSQRHNRISSKALMMQSSYLFRPHKQHFYFSISHPTLPRASATSYSNMDSQRRLRLDASGRSLFKSFCPGRSAVIYTFCQNATAKGTLVFTMKLAAKCVMVAEIGLATGQTLTTTTQRGVSPKRKTPAEISQAKAKATKNYLCSTCDVATAQRMGAYKAQWFQASL